MANTIITKRKNRLVFTFNDDSAIVGFTTCSWPKESMLLENNNGKLILSIGTKSIGISHTSISNGLKIDSVNGIVPANIDSLYSSLEELLDIDIVNSSNVSCSVLSNANVATLISSVNTYLIGSTKKFLGVDYEMWGTVTPTFTHL